MLFVAFFQYLYLFNYDSFQFDLFNDFYHFILQLLFISSWGFEDGHSFNAPIWSVSVEIGIYIVFFIFLKQFKKYQLNLSIILTIILILIDKSKFFDTLFLECARLFFSGVLIYFIINRNYNYSKTLIASVVLLILSFVGNFKTFLFCPSIVLFFLSFEKFIVRDRIKSIFSLLGNLTYALYLLHVPFQLLIIFFFDKYLIDMNYFFSLSFFLIYFIILFAISHLIFVFYEKPLNKKIRKSLLNT